MDLVDYKFNMNMVYEKEFADAKFITCFTGNLID